VVVTKVITQMVVQITPLFLIKFVLYQPKFFVYQFAAMWCLLFSGEKN